VTLAELAAEGFGWDSPCIRTPKDAVDVLARQLDDHLVVDDLGRRCVTRQVARELFTERTTAEQRQREVAAAAHRHAAELDEQFRAQLRGGIPASEVPDGVTVVDLRMQAGKDAQPKRRSVLQEALGGGGLVYHPIRPDQEEDGS
jgi:hypothetical protein